MKSAEAIAKAERLLERALELNALRYGEFTLTSGGKTSYYFDGRLLTTDGEGVAILSELFVDILMRRDIHRFGGPAVAAVPIIGGIALAAYEKGFDIKGYFVRSEQKQYGMGKQIEGHLSPDERVAVWDDTINTGGSIIDAAEAVSALPAKVDLALCILDRKQGGGEKLTGKGIPVFNILSTNSEGQIRVETDSLRNWFE